MCNYKICFILSFVFIICTAGVHYSNKNFNVTPFFAILAMSFAGMGFFMYRHQKNSTIFIQHRYNKPIHSNALSNAQPTDKPLDTDTQIEGYTEKINNNYQNHGPYEEGSVEYINQQVEEGHNINK